MIEISRKQVSVTDFKKLVSRIQKGEKESRIAKKEMVEAKLKISDFNCKKIYKQRLTVFRSYSRRKYWFNESS